MKNTLKEECMDCHEIYLTNMADLQREWVSRCPSCKSISISNFHNAVSGAYSDLVKAGA